MRRDCPRVTISSAARTASANLPVRKASFPASLCASASSLVETGFAAATDVAAGSDEALALGRDLRCFGRNLGGIVLGVERDHLRVSTSIVMGSAGRLRWHNHKMRALVAVCLAATALARIHELTIVRDDRFAFSIEGFGFLEGGQAKLTLSQFSVSSHSCPDPTNAPLSMLAG
jgi:hypothetical protein